MGRNAIRRNTERMELFARTWLINGRNATAAAVACGVSYSNAGCTANRWLKDPIVTQILAGAQKKAITHLDATYERIVQEMARLAFADVRSTVRKRKAMVDMGPGIGIVEVEFDEPIPLSELDEDTARAVTEYDSGTDKKTGLPKTTRVKLANKLQALTELARIQGLDAPTRIEHSGSIRLLNLDRLTTKDVDMLIAEVVPAMTLPAHEEDTQEDESETEDEGTDDDGGHSDPEDE